MPCYAKIDTSKPILNGAAVSRFPQSNGDATQLSLKTDRAESLATMPLDATLATRFQHGGVTAWERPGSNYAG